MKSINTLIPDIHHLVQHEKGWFDEQISDALRASTARTLCSHFNEPRYRPGKAKIRMSGLGPKCPCALWYAINHPELAEPLPPWAEVKFAYGYILEGLAITLARAAGHTVEGEQDELILDGIIGHRDAVVDGVVVDFKSCSSIAFRKFKDRSLKQNDSFGYLDQLSAYVVASADEEIVRVKDRGYFVAIDKTLGHMVLYEHIVEDPGAIRQRIAQYKVLVERPTPPVCTCGTRKSGESGNIELGITASYSPYKYCCFPNLRTFRYSGGVKYLSKVLRKPEVTEVNRYGKVVYH